MAVVDARSAASSIFRRFAGMLTGGCVGRGPVDDWCVIKRKNENSKRKDRRRRQRKLSQQTRQTTKGMFWNGRGIVDKIDEIIAYMEQEGVAYCMVSETRNYGRDLSRGKWKWVAGDECVPEVGCPTPPKGLGALVNTKLLPSSSVVKSTNQALWLRVPGAYVDLYLGGVYLPCGPSARRTRALESISADYKTFQNLGLVVLGGDLNARCGMNGDTVIDSRGRRLMEFSYERDLTIVNGCADLCSGEYTRELLMTVAGSKVLYKTTIDYILIPSNQLKNVVKLEIAPDSGLTSDHKPLILTIAWQSGKKQSKPASSRLKWQTAGMTEGDWNHFELLCTASMVNWNKSFNNDHDEPQRKLERGVESITTALESCATQAIGRKKVGKSAKGWWNAELTALVKQRRKLCVEIKSLTGEELVSARTVLCRHRKTLKALCRKSRRAWERDCADKIDKLGQSSRQFNSRWRRHLETGSKRIPDTVLDESGDLATQPIKVLQAWRDYLCKLCKDDTAAPGSSDRIEHNTKFDDEFADRVLQELRTRSRDLDGKIHELDTIITWDEVVSALSSLPDGKCGGRDGLIGEILRKAGIGFATAITCLFNHIWTFQVWPEAWRKAFLIPLYKGEGLLTSPSNYRLLALTSVLAKTFEKVLDARLRSWAERMGSLSDFQGGFRAGRGCSDQIFVLHEIVAKRKEEKLQTFLAFLDVSKAYDRVWRPGLWHKLRNLGVGAKVLTMLQAMFGRVIRNILVNDTFTDYADLQTGVPQGAVLSPYLYAVFINGLAEVLCRAGLGVQIYGCRTPILLYADDIVLLAANATELQQMLEVVAEYARTWRFEFNQKKCGVVIYGNAVQKRLAAGTTFLLAGEPIAMVSHYKYLGVEVGDSRAQWNTYLTRMYARARLELGRLAWKSGGFRTLSITSLKYLWTSQIRPILEYSAEIWEGNISATWERKLESVQNLFAKMAIGFSRMCTPAAAGVRAEVALPELKSRRCKLKLGFWGRLCKASPHRLVATIFRNRLQEVKAGTARLSCLQSMRACLIDCGLAMYWNESCIAKDWTQKCEVAVAAWTSSREVAEIHARSSLRLYRNLGQLGHNSGPAAYLHDRLNTRGTRLLTFARLGQLNLMGRISKLVGWPPAGSHCVLCTGNVCEDVKHFLTVCPLLHPCRARLLREIATALEPLGEPGVVLLEKCGRGGDALLEVVLGRDHPELQALVEVARTQKNLPCIEECGRARWVVDKIVKNYIVACWKIREAAMGRFRVEGGQLLHSYTETGVSVRELLALQDEPLKTPADRVMRIPPQLWIPRAVKQCPNKKKPSERAAFYIVFRGWTTGLFYKWAESMRALKGHPDPHAKGYRTLTAALNAWQIHSSSSANLQPVPKNWALMNFN